jgi:hypothetical protein
VKQETEEKENIIKQSETKDEYIKESPSKDNEDNDNEEDLEEVKAVMDREELVYGRVLEVRYADYLKLLIEDAKAKEDEVSRREAENGRTGNAGAVAVKVEKKRQKEEAALEFSDYHPYKGWTRTGYHSTMMSLRAETNATKLLTKNIFNPNLIRLSARPGSVQAEHGGYVRKSDHRITAAMVRGPYNKTIKKLRLNGDVTPGSAPVATAVTSSTSNSKSPPPSSSSQDQSSRDDMDYYEDD